MLKAKSQTTIPTGSTLPRTTVLTKRGAEKLAYSIKEACNITGLGRTLLYAEIGSGKLVARKCGRRTVILADDLITYLMSLPRDVANDRGCP